MSFLRMFSRKAAAAMTLLAGWLAASAVWAQVGTKTAAKEDTSITGTGPYVFAYMFLILCLALGLLVVCRSANRRDRARPVDYVESGLTDNADRGKGKK